MAMVVVDHVHSDVAVGESDGGNGSDRSSMLTKATVMAMLLLTAMAKMALPTLLTTIVVTMSMMAMVLPMAMTLATTAAMQIALLIWR